MSLKYDLGQDELSEIITNERLEEIKSLCELRIKDATHRTNLILAVHNLLKAHSKKAIIESRYIKRS